MSQGNIKEIKKNNTEFYEITVELAGAHPEHIKYVHVSTDAVERKVRIYVDRSFLNDGSKGSRNFGPSVFIWDAKIDNCVFAAFLMKIEHGLLRLLLKKRPTHMTSSVPSL